MIQISDFTINGLNVTWTLLYIGYVKFKELGEQDIVNYAISKMEHGDELLDVVLLASSNYEEKEEIEELLGRLSNSENSDFNLEFKKWRVVYVLNNLPMTDSSYIDGLVNLGDIWALFDFPDDSPHYYQGRNNNMSPTEYYTKENYNNLLAIHRKWISEELSKLRRVQ